MHVGCDAFDGDGAEAVKVDEGGIFGAVAKGAGGDGYGVLHGQGAELNG